MNVENSKTNVPHKFVLNLSQRINLKSSKKKCCPSKPGYLLHLEKYKAVIQKQQTQNNSSSLE